MKITFVSELHQLKPYIDFRYSQSFLKKKKIIQNKEKIDLMIQWIFIIRKLIIGKSCNKNSRNCEALAAIDNSCVLTLSLPMLLGTEVNFSFFDTTKFNLTIIFTVVDNL